jgi:hypothetical protein
MMRTAAVTIFFSLILTSASQLKNENSPDFIFKSFATAFLQQDIKKMKSLSIFTENLKILLQMPKLEKEKLEATFKKLKETPIKWYQEGDLVKIRGGQIRVNVLMANENKRIGTVHVLDFVYPLALKKLRNGQWVVDPTFMVQSVKKQVDSTSKRKRKNFRIDLDGVLYYLNEDEKVTFTDENKKEHVLKLFKNDIQHYKDGRISFQYHKDMEVFPGPSKNGFVYTLNSDVGPEVHVLIFNKGSKIKDEQDKFINAWIENYEVKDARFEEKRLKDVKQSINGQEHAGKVMYVILNGKVIYNQFYFLEVEGQVIGLFGKSKSVDAGLLNQYLTIVCESIKPGKGRGKK